MNLALGNGILSDVPDDFLRCQTLGHAWDDYDDSDWTPTWGVGLALRCLRCGTSRRDIINANGDLGSRSYVYPDGYKYGKGERPSRGDFRLMLIQKRLSERRQRRVNGNGRKAATS